MCACPVKVLSFFKLLLIFFWTKMTTEVEDQNIIKSILNVRCREGATIADIKRKSWHTKCAQLMPQYHNLDYFGYIFKEIMKKSLENHFWTFTITWTAWTVFIVLQVQIVNQNGMPKATICNILQSLYWNRGRHFKNQNHNKYSTALSMEIPIAFLKIISFTKTCGK